MLREFRESEFFLNAIEIKYKIIIIPARITDGEKHVIPININTHIEVNMQQYRCFILSIIKIEKKKVFKIDICTPDIASK